MLPFSRKNESPFRLCLASIARAQNEGKTEKGSGQVRGGDVVRKWIPVCGLSDWAKKSASGSKNDVFWAKGRSRASTDSAEEAFSPCFPLDSGGDSTDTAP